MPFYLVGCALGYVGKWTHLLGSNAPDSPFHAWVAGLGTILRQSDEIVDRFTTPFEDDELETETDSFEPVLAQCDTWWEARILTDFPDFGDSWWSSVVEPGTSAEFAKFAFEQI